MQPARCADEPSLSDFRIPPDRFPAAVVLPWTPLGNLSALIGVGSIGLSAIVAAYVIWQFNVAPPEGGHYTQVLWQWMSVDGFAPNFALYLDGLSVTMLGVVVGVGFLIHLFASWYMRGEAGYSRFFAYTNLFIASMLFLVLGDNLLFLYFGWEGVGLCSYLLIGFYYSNRNNGNAALKASSSPVSATCSWPSACSSCSNRWAR